MEPQPRITRAELAEYVAVNGNDPGDVALFLYDKGLDDVTVEAILSTLDSY